MSSKVYRVNDKNLIRQTTSNKKGAEDAAKFIASSFYYETFVVHQWGHGQDDHFSYLSSPKRDNLNFEGIS